MKITDLEIDLKAINDLAVELNKSSISLEEFTNKSTLLEGLGNTVNLLIANKVLKSGDVHAFVQQKLERIFWGKELTPTEVLFEQTFGVAIGEVTDTLLCELLLFLTQKKTITLPTLPNRDVLFNTILLSILNLHMLISQKSTFRNEVKRVYTRGIKNGFKQTKDRTK